MGEITLSEMTALRADLYKKTIKECMPILRKFRDAHGLTDRQAIRFGGWLLNTKLPDMEARDE